MDLVHVAVGSDGCFRRIVAVLTCAQVRRVPIPPMMFGVRLFISIVMLRRFPKKFCQCRDVHNSSCFRISRLPVFQCFTFSAICYNIEFQ